MGNAVLKLKQVNLLFSDGVDDDGWGGGENSTCVCFIDTGHWPVCYHAINNHDFVATTNMLLEHVQICLRNQ